MHLARLLAVLLGFALAFAPGRAWAQQELLQNRSFEEPIAPGVGNNFYAAITGWTTQDVNPAPPNNQPVNLIRPDADYGGGPTTARDGAQYFDVNSASGRVRQTITVPSNGVLTISAWFSTRDGTTNIGGLTVRLLNSGGGVVATNTITAPAFRQWYQAGVAEIAVTAGTYVFELVLPNEANVDLASAVFTPRINVVKTSAGYSDPVNGTTRPKQIPGSVVEYTITASRGAGAGTTNAIVLVDRTPANLVFLGANMGTGTGPVAFTTTQATGFTLPAANVDFSPSTAATPPTTWTQALNTAATGDPQVRWLRVRPTGNMAAGTSFTIRVRYLVL